MLIKKNKKYRPEDVCLNIGIGGNGGDDLLDFYILDESDSEKGLSTFSKKDAEYVQSTTHIKLAEKKNSCNINQRDHKKIFS